MKSNEDEINKELYDLIDLDMPYLIKRAIEKGADINITDINGRTPLFTAVLHNKVEALKCLLQAGANPDQKDNPGDVPLLHAIRYDDSDELTKLLLENGANPNIVGDKGNTPLHLAVIERKVGMVKLLLDKGASVDAQNDKGQKPADYNKDTMFSKCSPKIAELFDDHYQYSGGKAVKSAKNDATAPNNDATAPAEITFDESNDEVSNAGDGNKCGCCDIM